MGGVSYAGAQFEPGSVATPFENISIQTQLANCQRYFQIIDFNRVMLQGASSSSNAIAVLGATTSMRDGAVATNAEDGSSTAYYSTGRYEGNKDNNTEVSLSSTGYQQGTFRIGVPRTSNSPTANEVLTIGGNEYGMFAFAAEL